MRLRRETRPGGSILQVEDDGRWVDMPESEARNRGLAWLTALEPVAAAEPFILPFQPRSFRDVLLYAYWDLIQEELHHRRRQGMRPDAAAADLLLGAKFQDTLFATWDSPERLLRNVRALYEEWDDRPQRLPDKLARLDTLRQQGLLALKLPDATPCVMHRR